MREMSRGWTTASEPVRRTELFSWGLTGGGAGGREPLGTSDRAGETEATAASVLGCDTDFLEIALTGNLAFG